MKGTFKIEIFTESVANFQLEFFSRKIFALDFSRSNCTFELDHFEDFFFYFEGFSENCSNDRQDGCTYWTESGLALFLGFKF